MKNWRMSTKISLIVIIALVIGLTALTITVRNSATKSMTDVTQNRLIEASDARSTLITEYMSVIQTYIASIAKNPIVKEALLNETDKEKQAVLQAYILDAAGVQDNLEGLFVCNLETLQIAHSVEAAVGGFASSRENMESIYTEMKSTKGAYFRGINVSPTTGAQVIVNYYPVFNGDELIGYVGAGINAAGLVNLLDELQFQGLTKAYYTLLSVGKNQYVFADDDTKIGTEITETEIASLMQTAVTNNTGTSTYTDSVTGVKVISAYTYISELGMVFIVSDPVSEALASTNALSTFVVILSIVAVIVISGITFVTVTLVAKDLVKVKNVIGDIGQSMDMTKSDQLKSYADRKDEVGQIAGATTALTKAVSEAVEELQRNSAELAETARSLSSISEDTLNSVSQVDLAVQDIAQGATSQAQETEKASSSVVDIGNEIEETVSKTADMKIASDRIKASSDSAMDIIDNLSKIGTEATKAVEEIYEQTNVTNSSANRIKEATAIIANIAEETNLLSLNASIEAARAGEAGRGFAVVASQIQKLAEQSNDSAKLIEGITTTLIEDSNNAVSTMEEVKKIMAEQSECVSQVSDMFGQVKNGIDETIEGINEISHKASAMDQSRNAVVDTVQNLSAIAEENAASAEETSASTTVVTELMGDISTSATKLSEIAEDMDKTVSVFKI